MGGAIPKTLTPILGGQTILEFLLREIEATHRPHRTLLFLPEPSAAAQEVLDSVGAVVEVHVEEPRGYFRDLVRTKRRLNLHSFAIIDSDLVAEPGAITRFLNEAAEIDAWLTIGVSTMPERDSGRPAWVTRDDSGRIHTLDRERVAAHRTVGAFRWGSKALTDAGELTEKSSVMSYIGDHLCVGDGIRSVLFDSAVNVNTKADIEAARELRRKMPT